MDMYPIQSGGSSLTPYMLPVGNYMFAPGVFLSDEDSNAFLSSLDSDTRDYVIKHTSEFRSKKEIDDCISRLHGES
ncbi:MAG TPA: hypothetical protein VN131_05775 [Mobilitalea sp.]|nr:hypothetical protein [Mobilitalea sp.]